MSMVDLPALKPHCDSRYTCIANFCSLLSITRTKISPTITNIIVKGNNVGVMHVLRHRALSPPQVE